MVEYPEYFSPHPRPTKTTGYEAMPQGSPVSGRSQRERTTTAIEQRARALHSITSGLVNELVRRHVITDVTVYREKRWHGITHKIPSYEGKIGQGWLMNDYPGNKLYSPPNAGLCLLDDASVMYYQNNPPNVTPMPHRQINFRTDGLSDIAKNSTIYGNGNDFGVTPWLDTLANTRRVSRGSPVAPTPFANPVQPQVSYTLAEQTYRLEPGTSFLENETEKLLKVTLAYEALFAAFATRHSIQ